MRDRIIDRLCGIGYIAGACVVQDPKTQQTGAPHYATNAEGVVTLSSDDPGDRCAVPLFVFDCSAVGDVIPSMQICACSHRLIGPFCRDQIRMREVYPAIDYCDHGVE